MKHNQNKTQKPSWVIGGLGTKYCEYCGVSKSTHKTNCELKKGTYP